MGKKKKKSRDKALPAPPLDPSAPRSTLTAFRQNQRYKKEAKRLQVGGSKLLISKSAFNGIIRRATEDLKTPNSIRWTPKGLLCLQEATEEFLTTVLGGAYLCTLHRGSVTLHSKDVNLYLRCRYHPQGSINGTLTIK